MCDNYVDLTIRIQCNNEKCLSFHEINSSFDFEKYFWKGINEIFDKCPSCASNEVTSINIFS